MSQPSLFGFIALLWSPDNLGYWSCVRAALLKPMRHSVVLRSLFVHLHFMQPPCPSCSSAPKQTSAAAPGSGALPQGLALVGHHPQQPGQVGMCLARRRAVKGTGVSRGEMGPFHVPLKMSLQNLAPVLPPFVAPSIQLPDNSIT